MDARPAQHAQREPRRLIRSRQAGFTLLEVMIAAALAVIVIAGLAAASMSAARTNREAATLGAPERALHETLELIANDLRVNNGDGAHRCGQSGSRITNNYTVTWRTYRVSLDSNGAPTQQATCGTTQQQGTLLVRGMTRDGNVQHTRETLVSLTRGSTPTIANFTSNLTEVRPGDSVTFTWRLNDNPPAGTVTYLNEQPVTTDPNTLTGTKTITVPETTTFELVADSPFGADNRSLTVNAGNAPIFRTLRTEPELYIPGQPLTFHWEIDPAPLGLTNAQRLTSNGLSARNLPTNGTARATGQHTGVIPESRAGTLQFPFTATSPGGTTRKTIAVQECPRPTINLSASPTTISREGDINTTSTIAWSLTNAARATVTVATVHGGEVGSAPITGAALTNGSLVQDIVVPEGSTYVYDVRLVATSHCGRPHHETLTITAIADYMYIPPPPEPEPDPEEDEEEEDDNGGGHYDPRETCDDLDWDDVYCACFEGIDVRCV